jgi:hypothetical protein
MLRCEAAQGTSETLNTLGHSWTRVCSWAICGITVAAATMSCDGPSLSHRIDRRSSGCSPWRSEWPCHWHQCMLSPPPRPQQTCCQAALQCAIQYTCAMASSGSVRPLNPTVMRLSVYCNMLLTAVTLPCCAHLCRGCCRRPAPCRLLLSAHRHLIQAPPLLARRSPAHGSDVPFTTVTDECCMVATC